MLDNYGSTASWNSQQHRISATLKMIVPFPLAESQAAAVARIRSGRLTFLNPDEMAE